MAESFRCVMEVLKWVEPKTTLESAAVVCALWTQISDSEELWREYIEAGELEELVDCDLQSMKQRYREAIDYANIDRFILISNAEKVKVFQFTTETFLSEFTPPSNVFKEFSGIAILSKKELFVCGGETRNAHLISLRERTVTVLPSMFESRYCHSVLSCYRKVYVFGGYPVHISKTAECFALKEKEWQRLPDMINRRSNFNACFKDKKIYLCGGYTSACEVFDIITLQYTSLNFPLPRKYWTVLFFYDNQLVAIIANKVYFLEKTGWREVNLEINSVPFESSGAVVQGHLVYIPMNSTSRILKIDMNTLKGFDLLKVGERSEFIEENKSLGYLENKF